MKLRNWSLMLLGLAVMFTACNNEDEVGPEQTDTINEAQVEILANAITEQFMRVEIAGGDEKTGFNVTNYGLIDAFSTEDESMNERRPANGAAENRFASCLAGLSSDREQMMKIRMSFVAYNQCKAAHVNNFRKVVQELNARMERARIELLKKHREGEIDRDQLGEELKALRTRYAEALTNIKERHQDSFQNCLSNFLRRLNTILDEDQWLAFRNCVAG